MTEHIPDDRLQDLFDDRTPAADRPVLEEHLERCDTCADRWSALEELRDRAAQAPRGLAPPADWWPEIRTAIEERKVVPMGGGGAGRRRRPWWSRPLPAIAAAVALVALTAALTTWFARRPPPMEAPTGRMAAELTGYEATARALLREFEAQRAKLPPAAQEDVIRTLLVVDSAIREIQAVLQVDPTNETLLGVLVASYRQKVALLEHVNQAAS